MEIVFGYLFIFAARIVAIALLTIRCLLSMRGRKVEAAFVGFAQSAIYVLILGKALTSIHDPFMIIVYAGGFACGTYVGTWLEERLGSGYKTVEMVCKACQPEDMATCLRDAGFGVTVLEAEGREGPVNLLFITHERRAYSRLMSLISEKDPDAFITVLEARQAYGGIINHRVGK